MTRNDCYNKDTDMTEQNQTQRKDAGKPRYDLLPVEFLQDIQEIQDGQELSHLESLQTLIAFWRRDADEGDLALPASIEEIDGVCKVLAFGADKYTPRGWEDDPMTFSRVYRSALSHGLKHQLEGGNDEESGLPHIDHYNCNILFLWTYVTRGYAHLDDRPDAPIRHRTETPEPGPFKPKVGDRFRLVKAHDRYEGAALEDGVTGVVERVDAGDGPSCLYSCRLYRSDGSVRSYEFSIGEDAVFARV